MRWNTENWLQLYNFSGTREYPFASMSDQTLSLARDSVSAMDWNDSHTVTTRRDALPSTDRLCGSCVASRLMGTVGKDAVLQ